MKPVYERKWFQAVALSGLLLIAGGSLVWGLMPPTAEKLYAQAEQLMNSDDPDEHGEALEKPIAEYFRRYPE